MQNGLFDEEQKQMWPLENISDTFSTLQLRRHDADYNPHHRFKQSEVLTYIASSESAIKSLRKLSEKDKKTLAVFLNFGQRKSNKFNA